MQLLSLPVAEPALVEPLPMMPYFPASSVVMRPHAAIGGVGVARGDGSTLGVGLAVGARVGLALGLEPTLGAAPGRRAKRPARARTATVADAANRRVAVFMLGNLHRIGIARSWCVVWIWRRAASTARSGARVGPSSSHCRAARSSERSSVMPAALPGARAARRR